MGDNVIRVDFRARQVLDDLKATLARTATRPVQLSDFLGVDGWGMANGVLFFVDRGWWEIWEPLQGHLARMGVGLPTAGEGDSEDAAEAARAVGEAVDRLECSGKASREDCDDLRGYWAAEGDRMCKDVFRQVLEKAPWHGQCYPRLLAFDGDLARSVLMAVSAYRVAGRRRPQAKVAERMPRASEMHAARSMAAELTVLGFPPSSVEFWVGAAFPNLTTDMDDVVRQGFEISKSLRFRPPASLS